MKRNDHTNSIIEEVHDYCIDFDRRQIYLHDSVKEDSEGGLDFRVATRFIKNMAILEPSGDPIVIHQFSYGGQCDAGFAIYDAIKTSCCHITIVSHGSTMSMASLILQAADERIAMPNCSFMFHEGDQSIGGTHKQVQAWAFAGKKIRDKILHIYAERCKDAEFFAGKSLSKVKSYLRSNFDRKEDWILTAEEALNYGFIDSIVLEKGLTSLVKGS